MAVYKATELLYDIDKGKYFYPLTVASQVDMGNGTKLDAFLENEFGTELLWTNASPNSDFAEQTINLNLKKYNSIKIVFKAAKTSSAYRKPIDIPILNGNYYIVESTCYEQYSRDITITETSITFKVGKYLADGSSEVQGNQYFIPMYIYGVK